MLLYCIDEKTGNVFDIASAYNSETGEQFYTAYLDGVQSTALFYVKKLFLLSSSDYLNISMPENEVFTLLYADQNEAYITGIPEIEINENKYKELDGLFTQANVALVNKYTSVGFKLSRVYNNMYIHPVYVLAHADMGGTFTENLVVKDLVGNETIITVGGDFYEENEVLKSNIQNFGIEIPEQFTKAVYSSNVYDEAIDNVLLNRKRRELLNEYRNLEYQKGNINSLENSLKFFEWGDKVQMVEYWKVLNEFNNQLFERNINKLMTEEISENLDSMTKTTIFGLHLALNKYVELAPNKIMWECDTDEKYSYGVYPDGRFYSAKVNGDFDTEDKAWTTVITDEEGNLKDSIAGMDILVDPKGEKWMPEKKLGSEPAEGATWTRRDRDSEVLFIAENNPVLIRKAFSWSKIELELKMRLLACFYATYFMPIHTDLIQSSLEDWAFSDAIKMLSWANIKQSNSYNTNGLQLDLNTDSEVYWLDSNVCLDNYDYTQTDTHYTAPKRSAFNFVPFNMTYFDGIGVVANLSTNIKELAEKFGIEFKQITFGVFHELDGKTINDCVGQFYHENCMFTKDSYFDYCDRCEEYVNPVGGEIEHYTFNSDYDREFSILLRYPGTHIISATLETYNGDKIVATKNVEVKTNITKNIEVKKLGYTGKKKPNWQSFAFDATFIYDESSYYDYMRRINTEYANLKTEYNLGFNGLIISELRDCSEEAYDELDLDAEFNAIKINNIFECRKQLFTKWYRDDEGNYRFKLLLYIISENFITKDQLPDAEDIADQLGIDDWNVECKMVFIPLLNTLYDLDGTETNTTCIVLVPNFETNHTQLTESWVVENKCVPYNKIELNNMHNPILTNDLLPGIYKVTYKYQFGQHKETEMIRTFDRAFQINKV